MRRRLRSVSLVVGLYSLTFRNLDDDETPLEIVVRCTRCEAEIARRRYDMLTVDRLPAALAGLGLRAQTDAELDGERN